MPKKTVRQWDFKKKRFDLAKLRSAKFEAPRKHTDEEVAVLTLAVREEGQMRPIVVAEDGEILDGAMVCHVLKSLGKKTTDCVVMVGLDRKQKTLFRAAVNKLWRTLTLDGSKLMATKLVEIGRRDSAVRLSDRRIAVLCGLTHKSVSALRRKWEEIEGREESAVMILGRDNKKQKPKRKPRFKPVRPDELAGDGALPDVVPLIKVRRSVTMRLLTPRQISERFQISDRLGRPLPADLDSPRQNSGYSIHSASCQIRSRGD